MSGPTRLRGRTGTPARLDSGVRRGGDIAPLGISVQVLARVRRLIVPNGTVPPALVRLADCFTDPMLDSKILYVYLNIDESRST